jgi:Fe-S-cluster containining protein
MCRNREKKQTGPAAHSRLTAKQPLTVPAEAVEIRQTITQRLLTLRSGLFESCTDPRFGSEWEAVTRDIDRYQEAVARNAGREKTCAAGCASCCFHWVEDVNSFEAELIADLVRREMPDRVGAVVDRCERDGRELERLNAIVEAKLAAAGRDGEEIDPVDLLLASWYRLKRPCPLLDPESGTCLVYPLRPLTCRMYVSFSDPARCVPGRPDGRDIPTYLFDLEEEADGIIDALHFKFLRFEGDTGLRSLLGKYLSIDNP